MALLAFEAVGVLSAKPFGEKSLEQLEQRLKTIDTELDSIARLTLRTGVGNIGWISRRHRNPAATEWAEIRLAEEVLIDQVILAPIIWNDSNKGPQADGFPQAFEVIAGVEGDTTGQVIASYGPGDNFLPRTAPLLIPVSPTMASWIRIHAVQMSKDARTGRYVFNLSEIMVFSDGNNVALDQPVKVSSNIGGWANLAIYKESLVDGLTPYLIDSPLGKESLPFKAFFKEGRSFSFTIDLMDLYPIDGINLHTMDLSENAPQITPSNFGIPKQLLIEGATLPDFSDAVPLMEHRRSSVYDSGPVLIKNFPEITCQYIRFSVKEAYKLPESSIMDRCVVFAEVEILSKGRNVALGKKVIFVKNNIRLLFKNALTDGMNHYGEILPLEEWMIQLALRHELEQERPEVAHKITSFYIHQRTILRRMVWIISLLTAGLVFIILFNRLLHQRAILKTRNRIAANLHDELGANLSAINLLSGYAQGLIKKKNGPLVLEELSETIEDVLTLTKETEQDARRCTNLLAATGGYENLIKELERISERLLADSTHEIHFENKEAFKKLLPRKRLDLTLFYKESLNNIVRHAKADKVVTRFTGTKNGIRLSITDNGIGLPNSLKSITPPSLKRRAALLGGKTSVETPDEGGTRIHLFVHFRRSSFNIITSS